MTRPIAPGDRVKVSRRRIARLEPFAIPIIVWAQAVLALAVWGWSLGAIIKALSP